MPAPAQQDPSVRGPFDVTGGVDGPIVKNKTFFFGIWDNCVLSTVVTDSMGRFEFSNVGAAEYVVSAQRDGFSGPAASVSQTGGGGRGVIRYWSGWNPGPQLTGDSMRVTVDAQQASQDISLSLVRAGVIAGHVRDADGKLVVNAQVRIVTAPAPGATGEGPLILKTATSDVGEYRAYWLPPGEYRVVASGPRTGAVWFLRPASATEGTSIVLREGEEVSNIDIVLRPGAEETPFNRYFPPVLR